MLLLSQLVCLQSHINTEDMASNTCVYSSLSDICVDVLKRVQRRCACGTCVSGQRYGFAASLCNFGLYGLEFVHVSGKQGNCIAIGSKLFRSSCSNACKSRITVEAYGTLCAEQEYVHRLRAAVQPEGVYMPTRSDADYDRNFGQT